MKKVIPAKASIIIDTREKKNIHFLQVFFAFIYLLQHTTKIKNTRLVGAKTK